MDEFITVKKAAEIFPFGETKIRELIKQKKFKTYQEAPNCKILISLSDANRFFNVGGMK